MSEIKIKFSNFYLLGNFQFSDRLLDSANQRPEFKYIGKLEYDRKVEEMNLQGKSLLELQDDSPALDSIKKIAATCGY